MRDNHRLIHFALALCLGSMLPAQPVAPLAEFVAGSAQATPAGLTDGEWSSIRAAYEASQHAVSKVDGAYQARNPGQAWLTRFEDGGFLVKPDVGNWTWGLELLQYGFAGHQQEVCKPSKIQADGSRASYRWDAVLEEWYVNDRRGLEHGYTVYQRPDRKTGDTSPLTFTLAVRGGLSMAVTQDKRGVRFVDQAGRTALTYTGLTVFDADGKDVKAHFRDCNGLLSLAVEERDARYPLTIDPIVQQAYLKASNTDPGDHFGYSVSISGDTVVVGAPLEDSKAMGINGNQADNSAGDAGAAYVFVRSNYRYVQQAYLKASNTDAGDFFGVSVSISGDTIVVGAPFDDSIGTGVNANQGNNGAGLQSGAAYVFVRNGSTWTQEVYLKASNTRADYRFAQAVAVSGDSVVVGSCRESYLDYNSGAAYVFVRTAPSSWIQQGYLKADNGGPWDWFGWSVAISGDTAVVGTPFEDSKATGVNGNGYDNSASLAGAAYVYVRTGSGWNQQAFLKASNTDAGDYFGNSVGIAADTVVVGASREASQATGVNGNQRDNQLAAAGAGYVYVRKGIVWSQQAYLKASNTGGGDYFGVSVGISADTVAVGASREASNAIGVNGNQGDNSARSAGAAYVFDRNGTTWSQQAYLKASNTDAGDEFGFAIAISGDTVVVGAQLEASKATDVNGDQSDNSAVSAGAVYAFGDVCRLPASSGRVGVGCIATGAPPTLDSTPPVQGKTCRWLASSSLSNVTGVVLVGIPHKGAGLGFGCTVYFDLTLPTIPVFFVTDATGGWQSPPFQISTLPRIMCSEVALQAAFDNPVTAPLGMALSNGVLVRIGY